MGIFFNSKEYYYRRFEKENVSKNGTETGKNLEQYISSFLKAHSLEYCSWKGISWRPVPI